MKKMMLLVGAVLSLTLFSFTGFQKEKIKIDEKGNYHLSKLKMSKEDIKKLAELTQKFERAEMGWKTVRVFKKTIKILNVDEVVVVEKSGKKDGKKLSMEAKRAADEIMNDYLR